MSQPSAALLSPRPAPRPLRVVLLCETFAPDMGYLTNALAKYLARDGFEMHVFSLGLPPYHRTADWRDRMPAFVSAQGQPAGTLRRIDGYTLHVLDHGKLGPYPYAKELGRRLGELKPDVVYSIGAIGALPLQAALQLPRLGFKLFTGNHTSAEAFPLARQKFRLWNPALLRALIMRWLPGRAVSLVTERCYCRTEGCGEIAQRFFGVQRSKIQVIPLGVDTEYFFPASDLPARRKLRAELGIDPDEIACINTGRMVAGKDLRLLDIAVQRLRAEGLAFRALFIGDGPERAALSPSCIVLPFRPFHELGDYYRAADIGVWPAGESTSMFDAAACGLPLIVSDRVDAHLDGNGLAIRTHDLDSLIEALRTLAERAARERMGALGARQMRERLAWEHAARIRIDDFRRAVER
jgi:glycosyltransferase involved in cell wall biosynthesis